MINVKDLCFKEDILPLFDFLNNDHSLDVLNSIFTTIPDSLQEIKERQHILKGFIAQKKNPALPVYGRSEFNESYRYITEFSHTASLNESRAGFLFNKRRRYTEAGRLTQLVIFLNKIRKSYFVFLDFSHFPVDFNRKINNLSAFLSNLPLEKYEPLSREKGLRIKDIIELRNLIYTNTTNAGGKLFGATFF